MAINNFPIIKVVDMKRPIAPLVLQPKVEPQKMTWLKPSDIKVVEKWMDAIPTRKVDTKEDYTKQVEYINKQAQSKFEWLGDVNEKEIQFMKAAKAQWYTKLDTMNFLEKKRQEENKWLIDKWIDTLTNIWGWIYKSATALPELWQMGWDYIASKLLSKEQFEKAKWMVWPNIWEQTDQMLNKAWVDQNSIAFQWSKLVWDIAQTAAPVWIGWKIPWIVKATSKIPWFIKTWAKLWIQGATDTIKYNAIADKRASTPWEIGVWAWLNVALGWLGNVASKWLRKTANWLELNWLANPKDIKTMAKALWTDNVGDVWEWAIKKNFVWSKDSILSKVDNFADSNYKATKAVLWKSNTLHKVPEAESALNKLLKGFGWDIPEAWLEELHTNAKRLLNSAKWKWLTLSQLDEVQKLQWEYLPNFTKSTEIKDTLGAKANANLYNKVKKYIEDIATKEWLWNIKTLKKDTQIAYILKNAIKSKTAADEARSVFSPFASTAAWGAIWAISWGNPYNDPVWFAKSVLLWVVGWKIANSKTLQSNLARLIIKSNWKDKSALRKLYQLIRRWSAVAWSNMITPNE